MTPSRGALARAGFGGAVCGASATGFAEALAVLASLHPSEYQALLYGPLLYAVVGAALGLVWAAAAASGGRAAGVGIGTAWVAAFVGTAGVLVEWLVLARLDLLLFRGRGVPLGAVLTTVAAVGGAGAVALFLGARLVERTPLRAIATARGTAAAWGTALVLALLFSRAPAPGAASVLAPHRPQPARFDEKPDVLLVLVDGLRADALAAGGTPALDRLAADAVVFEQHVVSAPDTQASVASLLTSLPPTSHGTFGPEARLPEAAATLAEQLRDAGYATGGLPDDAAVTGAYGFDQGFDWYPYTPDWPGGARQSSAALTLYGLARAALAPGELPYAPAADQLARAAEHLAANAGERTFTFVHLREPDSARDRAAYAAAVGQVDGQLGRFFDDLRADGRYDDTLIVVTADHGLALGEHGAVGPGGSLYDEQLHVPLLVKLPGGARAGTRVPWQVRQIDVAPTVLDVAGFAPHPTWAGASLFDDRFDEDLARLLPPEGYGPDDPPFLAPTWGAHPASRVALAELDGGPWRLEALRAAGRKVVRASRGAPVAPVQSFDLEEDPGETRNRAGASLAWELTLLSTLQRALDQAVRHRIDRLLGPEETAEAR